MKKYVVYAILLGIGVLAPHVFPNQTNTFSVFWVMVTLSLTWDMTGGQMGYNSLGNITFFGIGMYVAAVTQIGMVYDVGQYTAASGGGIFEFTISQYLTGLGLGSVLGGIVCAGFAVVLGIILFGLRGPYFAIGTLGVAIAGGELISNWEWVGGGQGITLPVYPGDIYTSKFLFYYVFFGLAAVTLVTLGWLYSTRFGHALNAIRDDEGKAEGMGLHTMRYKLTAWAIAAFFIGICGALFGHMSIQIEPTETAFQTINFGLFMVVCVLLGGKGTLWGPVVGALIFQLFKDVTWNYMLGTQWVALGVLIVVTVVYFREGVMGWMMRTRPEWFGIAIDETKSSTEAAQ